MYKMLFFYSTRSSTYLALRYVVHFIGLSGNFILLSRDLKK